MSQNSFSMEPFEAKRMRVESTRSFEDVRQNLQNVVGTATLQEGNTQEAGRVTRKRGETLGEAYHAAMQALGGTTREHFEQAVQSQVRESDFMLFHEINHGEWLPVFGIQRKVTRWILGNPLIAITMMRHDLTAGLFVPVEVLLVENESGKGSTLIYDLPSSLMVIEHNPALQTAARALDHKLATLVSRVTGVGMDQTSP